MSSENDLIKDAIEAEPIARPLDELPQTETVTGGDYVDDSGPMETPQVNSGAFDPSIHRVDATGNPVKNRDGTFAKKRGRKAGQTSQAKTGPIPVATMSAEQMEAENLGKATAETIFAVCQGVFGSEWTPIVDNAINERHNMQTAWSQYYLATGKRDLPPSLIVIVAMTCYAAPRFQHENTRTRFGGLGRGMAKVWGWVKNTFTKSRKKMEGE